MAAVEMMQWIKKLLHKPNKHYVSETDKFLADLKQTFPPSASQQEEIAKHRRIAKMRDKVQSEHKSGQIWQDF